MIRSLTPYLVGHSWVLFIDGRSGAGKSRLAGDIAEATGASILSLDELYGGWQGLARGSERVAAALDAGGSHSFDWATMLPSAKWQPLDRLPLIVEGCGAVSRDNLLAAERFVRRTSGENGRVTAVWIECPAEVRMARALARDGDMFAPHWSDWAAQEDAHAARHHARELADVTLFCETSSPAAP